MNVLQRTAMLILGAAAVAITGCTSTPAAALLTLPPAEPRVAMPPAGSIGHSVLVVRRLEIPEYLLAHRVRYRADDATLAEWPGAYWAERIETGMAREWGAALRHRLPGWQLCEANCSGLSPALALQVKLGRMDYVRSERRLKANAGISLWSNERPSRLLRTEQYEYSIAGDADTPQSHARAVTALLSRLAGDAALLVADTP